MQRSILFTFAGGLFGFQIGAHSALTLATLPITTLGGGLIGSVFLAVTLGGMTTKNSKNAHSIVKIISLAALIFATIGLTMLITGATFILATKFIGILAAYSLIAIIISGISGILLGNKLSNEK